MSEAVKKDQTKKVKMIAYARGIARLIPSILQLIMVIGFIPLLLSLTPYIYGSKELESAMTNSQLTAILLTLVVCYGIIVVSKMGRH